MKHLKLLLLVLGALFLACSTTPTVTPLPYRGTNLDGGQFGSVYPGTENVDYSWPTTKDVDYFASKNMNTFRIGFQWERLQPTLKGPFAAAYFTKLDALVKYATSKGMNVFLNPHNFARYKIAGKAGDPDLVGSAAVPNDAFADLWTRLAAQYKDNPRVMMSLVNEPHDMPSQQWVDAANAAIKGIRSTGNTNVVSVPGNAWTGAASWSSSWSPGYDTSNAVAMLKITDSANNYVFEVHNYFDADGSGEYKTDCKTATVGSQQLANVTSWARANKKKVIVGEFGTKISTLCQSAVADMLTYIHANPDVYVGWLWWSAGTPWGNSYLLGINPKNGVDDARMAWFKDYLPAGSTPAPTTTPTPTTPPPPVVVSPSFPSNPLTVTKNQVFTMVTPSNGITNWAFVPNSYDSTHKTPTQLFVWLHGCGGQSEFDAAMVSFMTNQNWISLAPGGREKACWSGVGTDGPKVLAAIAEIRTHFNIDPYRIVLGGYSSGGDIGYPLLFQNANMFAGGIFENTGPSTSAMTDANSAAWKVNIFHLAHTGDTTYPIAGIRTKMTTLKNSGFPVTLLEKAGTHYDNDNGTTGTEYDLRTFALPHLNDGWVAPGAPTPPVDAGTPVDSGTPPPVDAGPVDSGTPPPVDAGTPDSGTPDAGTPPDLKPVVRITYNWGSGYCEELDLANKTAGTLTWTQISLNLRGGTIRDQDKKGPPWDTWNGTFSARTGVITVKPASWNKTVAPGKKVTVGFCADFGPQKWTGTVVQGSLK